VRDRPLHLGAELRRRFCCGVFHVAAHFIARTRHRLSACGFELAANPIGFRDDPAIGFGGGVGETGVQTALPLFPDRVEFLAVTICRVIGSSREVLNLASRTLGLGGQPTLSFRLRSGELGLQTPIQLGSYGFDRCDSLRLGFDPRPLSLFGNPLGQLGSLCLELRLETRAESVKGGTKIVIGHFRHYPDGLRASQALRKRANPTATIV
jgi:hypothetical protein